MVLRKRVQHCYPAAVSDTNMTQASFKGLFLKTCRTSTQQTDGTKQPRLCIIHLQRKELVGEGKNQISEGTEASVVHLVSI